MNAPSHPRMSSLVLGGLALAGVSALGLACREGEGPEQHPKTEAASRNHDRDREREEQQQPREVVSLVPGPTDPPERRGVEPSPAQDMVGNHPAGEALAEERPAFIVDTRNRLVEVDQEIERLNVALQQRGMPTSKAIAEQRQVVARQFDELLRAPEGEWKEKRNQLAERLEELQFTVDQVQAAVEGAPFPGHGITGQPAPR